MSTDTGTDELPAEIAALIGVPQYQQTADVDVERSYTNNTCAATQNGNPVYWDAAQVLYV